MTALPDLTELQQFDTPTICNAIELFEVRPRTAGYMQREIAACFPELPPMVGYAATATFQVEFENPSQFNREYRRLFGTPPLREITISWPFAVCESGKKVREVKSSDKWGFRR